MSYYQHILKKIPPHTLGAGLSLSAAGLGVFRDVLLIYILGFSSLNDRLQIYLSLYFAVGMFADPLRLTYLNLISQRNFSELLKIFLSFALLLLVVFVGLMKCLDATLHVPYLFLAAFDAFLAIWVSLTAFHKQRFGAYLPAQCLIVLPAYLMIPCVLLLMVVPHVYSISIILTAFMLIHLLQLVSLRWVVIPQEPLKERVKWNDLSLLFQHGLSSLGEQLFQIVGRLLFLNMGAGLVTLISFFMKCMLSFRTIFVDSYIGAKLSTWDETQPPLVFRNQTWIIGLVVLCFFVAVWDTRDFYWIAAQCVLLGAISFYLSALQRSAYFKLNRQGYVASLVLLTGLIDFISALMICLCFYFKLQNHGMLVIYAWYVVRIGVELFVMTYCCRLNNTNVCVEQ